MRGYQCWQHLVRDSGSLRVLFRRVPAMHSAIGQPSAGQQGEHDAPLRCSPARGSAGPGRSAPPRWPLTRTRASTACRRDAGSRSIACRLLESPQNTRCSEPARATRHGWVELGQGSTLSDPARVQIQHMHKKAMADHQKAPRGKQTGSNSIEPLQRWCLKARRQQRTRFDRPRGFDADSGGGSVSMRPIFSLRLSMSVNHSSFTRLTSLHGPTPRRLPQGLVAVPPSCGQMIANVQRCEPAPRHR